MDLLLRSRGHPEAALTFARSLLAGVHRLETPSAAELELALKLGQRFLGSGAELPELVVMAMASRRRRPDSHVGFSSLPGRRPAAGYHASLVVGGAELPKP